MITRMTNLPIALRLALRELRGGLNGFRIFIACLILGVGAIAAVGSLAQSIEDGLNAEGRNILGGDIEISVLQNKLSSEKIDYFNNIGTLAKSVRFRTMTTAERSQQNTTPVLADTPESTLVELRGITDIYPLYGSFVTKPAQDTASLIEKRGDLWGTIIDPLLADRLQLQLGDILVFGNVRTEIRAFIENEPDKANLGFQLGPSVFTHNDALDASGLITLGSMINYIYKIKLPEGTDLEQTIKTIKADYPEATWRIRNRTNSAPGLRNTIDNMGEFLVIVGLAALVIGGVGVGNAVKGYMDRKTKTIATLKILGAQGPVIFWTYFYQILLIGSVSTLIGISLGAFLPELLAGLLPATIPVEIQGSLHPAALLTAAAYGLLVTTAFTAWPLGKARDLPAVRLFRALVSPDSKRPRGGYIVLAVTSLLIVGALAITLAENRWLAAIFLGASLGAFITLRGISWLIEKTAARMPRPKNALHRMALANLHRPGAATSAVVISLGLGLTLFAALALLEGNLRANLNSEFRNEAPAFFIVDIQKNQLENFKTAAYDIDGVSDVITVPFLRGVIKEINGTSSKDWTIVDKNYSWVLRGDRGLSYGNNMGTETELVEGDWWPSDYDGPPQISFGLKEAEGLGIGIGDILTINVLGRDIEAEIVSLREISWGNIGFNFVMMFDPNTLKHAPSTYMSTLKATPAAETEAHRTLTRSFPNITVIRMKEVLDSVQGVLNQISSAVSATSVVAIIAGILVLAGAIAAGFRQRVYESVILKVVGAIRRQVLWAYFLEYLFIGLITATIALALGSLAGYMVVTELWDLEFTFLPGPVFTTLAISLFVTIAMGLTSSWRALSTKPNAILRTE